MSPIPISRATSAPNTILTSPRTAPEQSSITLGYSVRPLALPTIRRFRLWICFCWPTPTSRLARTMPPHLAPSSRPSTRAAKKQTCSCSDQVSRVSHCTCYTGGVFAAGIIIFVSVDPTREGAMLGFYFLDQPVVVMNSANRMQDQITAEQNQGRAKQKERHQKRNHIPEFIIA